MGALHSAAGLSYWLDDCSAADQLASLSKVLGEGFTNYIQKIVCNKTKKFKLWKILFSTFHNSSFYVFLV